MKKIIIHECRQELHWIMLARVELICPEVEQVSEVANGPLVDIVATRRRFFIIRVCALCFHLSVQETYLSDYRYLCVM